MQSEQNSIEIYQKEKSNSKKHKIKKLKISKHNESAIASFMTPTTDRQLIYHSERKIDIKSKDYGQIKEDLSYQTSSDIDSDDY